MFKWSDLSVRERITIVLVILVMTVGSLEESGFFRTDPDPQMLQEEFEERIGREIDRDRAFQQALRAEGAGLSPEVQEFARRLGCNNRDDDGDGAVDNIEEAGAGTSKICYRRLGGACRIGVWRCNMAAGAGNSQLVCLPSARAIDSSYCEDEIG